jgi:hypothetical protein
MFGVEQEDKRDRGVGFVMNKCCRFSSVIKITEEDVGQRGYGAETHRNLIHPTGPVLNVA